jgi:3-oxoacyl-(acyl-carrier-protein) synthase
MEIVGGLLALKHQSVPATPHSTRANAGLPIPLATQRTDRELKTLLKLSTGFTGHDAALLFARI